MSKAQIKLGDPHPVWKHVETGGVYKLQGFGVWKGGPSDPAQDNQTVQVLRGGPAFGDFDVYPEHYTVPDGVLSGDIATMQTTVTLKYGDEVAVYVSEDDRVFVRRYADFYDGRFEKVGGPQAPDAPDEPDETAAA